LPTSREVHDKLAAMKSILLFGCAALIGAATVLPAAEASADPAACTAGAPDGLCVEEESCDCDDCFSDVTCGGCVDDGTCDQNDACTCPDCDADPVCNTQGSCTDNGMCNQFTESCACADCAEVENCLDNPPPGEGGAAGDGGSSAGGSNAGGSSADGGSGSSDGDDSGCSAAPRQAHGVGALALLAGLAVAGLRRRR
jgi:uncharacterized protein (TIGR03382 family)